jgi:hypothetical protein
LAIAAQETLPFDVPKVDDNNRYFKSGMVYAVRRAKIAPTVAKASFPPDSAWRRPTIGDNALATSVRLGNREGRLVQIRILSHFGGQTRRSVRRGTEPILSYGWTGKSDSRLGSDAPG